MGNGLRWWRKGPAATPPVAPPRAPVEPPANGAGQHGRGTATAVLDAPPAATMPSGTVTFLFTDIEGSTRLWDRSTAAMQAALARHDALMRQRIARARRPRVQDRRRCLLRRVPERADALAAALAAQHALHAEPWPEAATLRVRMALHTGARTNRATAIISVRRSIASPA